MISISDEVFADQGRSGVTASLSLQVVKDNQETSTYD